MRQWQRYYIIYEKMGYRQTERLLKEEAHVNNLETMAFELRNEQDSSIANYILFGGGVGVDPSGYSKAYLGLRRWIEESLDAFREELLSILYPVFIHCFLDMVAKGVGGDAKNFLEKFKEDHLDTHEDEINKLSALSEPLQIKENPLAFAFRTNKYNISMSAYAFQLLMGYLQQDGANAQSENVIFLKIINQFVNIRILVNSKNVGQAISVSGLTGTSSEISTSMNRNKVLWGVHPVEPVIESALVARGKMESRLNEVLQGPLAHLKRTYSQSSSNAPPSDRVPKSLEPNAAETNAEIDRLRNLARKANLSATSLPSICFYTLNNSFESVTSVDFSPNSNLMATGSKDSYIDIWSLNHEYLRSIRPSTELAALDLTDFTSLDPMRELEGSLCKRLVGHSGPVYSCKFVQIQGGDRLLLSSSQDCTIRLWSLDLFSCIVVYRGHTWPIWDLDVAPFGAGPYFVTGSADRTARLWSTEQSSPLRIFVGHLADVDVVRFHPNGNYIFTGSSDKTIRMWDIQNGSCVRLFSGHARAVSALCPSPDGRYLVSGDLAGELKIWDLAEGRLIRTIDCRMPSQSQESPVSRAAGAIYTVELDRDGRILTAAGADQNVRVFDFSKIIIDNDQSKHLLCIFPTKHTPILKLHFSYRNVLLGAGPFLLQSQHQS